MAKTIPIFVLFLIASSLVIQSKALSESLQGDKGGDGKGRSEVPSGESPGPVERAIGYTGLMNRWDVVRTWVRLALFKVGPESRYGRNSASTPTGKVTEAATESLKMAEGTVEQAAESAAEVADKAAHAAKKTLERTLSIHPRRKKDSSGSAEL